MARRIVCPTCNRRIKVRDALLHEHPLDRKVTEETLEEDDDDATD